MAKKKQPELTRGQRKRLRTQRVLFTVFAVLVVASFVLSLISN